MVGFTQLIDIGFGNALIGITANKNTIGGEKEVNKIVIPAFLAMFIFCIIVLMVIISIYCILTKYFKFKYFSDELEVVFYIYLVMIIINIPLNLIQQVRMGYQRGWLNNKYNFVGLIVSVLMILVVVKRNLGIELYTFSTILALYVGNLLNINDYIKKTKKFNINFKYIKIAVFKVIEKSKHFFIMQILVLISFNLDTLIIYHYLGSMDVATYSLGMKVFSLPGTLLSFLYAGLWAAYSDAGSKGDWLWIRKIYSLSLTIGLFISVGASIVLMYFCQDIIRLFSLGEISIESKLIFALGAWAGLSAIGGGCASLLNGLHFMRLQIYLGIISTTINILISIYLVEKIGVSGPVFGSVISLAVIYPVMIYVTYRKINSNI